MMRALFTLGPYAGLIAAAIAAYYLFPSNLGFVTTVVVAMIFVLSLDLVMGVAGISTLGHAALYGTGAYAAAIFATLVSADPLLGLAVGAGAGAAIAFVSGLFLMRAQGLTLLMLSIAVTEVLSSLANKYSGLTGGADGLSFTPGALFGRFEFDFYGQLGYIYAVCVFLVVFGMLRIVVASPFGLTARGIKESPARMRAIGTPVYWRLVSVYTFAGAIAGLAGALGAQSTALVSLNVYDFQRSAEAVIMLIIGGTGRLWGAVIGTIVFMTVHQVAASADPFNWLFVIGALVLAVVYIVPAGLLGLPEMVKKLTGGAR